MSNACFIREFTSKGISLQSMYEACCEEYRRRLCEMWEIPFDESWWHGDKIGGGLFLADWWMSLDMEELRYVVENNVTHEAWLEYCDYVESEFKGHDQPRINFFSWFNGLRPEMLED